MEIYGKVKIIYKKKKNNNNNNNNKKNIGQYREYRAISRHVVLLGNKFILTIPQYCCKGLSTNRLNRHL